MYVWYSALDLNHREPVRRSIVACAAMDVGSSPQAGSEPYAVALEYRQIHDKVSEPSNERSSSTSNHSNSRVEVLPFEHFVQRIDTHDSKRLSMFGRVRAGAATGISALLGASYGLLSVMLRVCSGSHGARDETSSSTTPSSSSSLPSRLGTPLRVGIQLQYGQEM